MIEGSGRPKNLRIWIPNTVIKVVQGRLLKFISVATWITFFVCGEHRIIPVVCGLCGRIMSSSFSRVTSNFFGQHPGLSSGGFPVLSYELRTVIVQGFVPKAVNRKGCILSNAPSSGMDLNVTKVLDLLYCTVPDIVKLPYPGTSDNTPNFGQSVWFWCVSFQWEKKLN